MVSTLSKLSLIALINFWKESLIPEVMIQDYLLLLLTFSFAFLQKKESGMNAKTEAVLIIIWCGFHSAAPGWSDLTLALIMTALALKASSPITGRGLSC